MPRQRRSKRWQFTLNNYVAQEEFELQAHFAEDNQDRDGLKLKFLMYSYEVGESGTPHLQGYFETEKRVVLSTLKLQPGMTRMHLEIAKGTLEQNREYITKAGPIAFESGTPMRQGKRSDLMRIKEAIDEGASMREVAEQHFSQWVVYRRSFAAYSQMVHSVNRSWKTKVYVLWGSTGVGKTRFAMDQSIGRTLWIPGDYEWFDGYENHEIVIFDDYRGEYTVQFLLRLLDRYPMTVKVKGGFVNWAPRKIYITSNVPPSAWYVNADQQTKDALLRRVDNIYQINENLY